jgi:hypothetical protein
MKKAIADVTDALRKLRDNTFIGNSPFDPPADIAFIAATAVRVAIDAIFPSKGMVLATYPWKTNADLIYDVWRLGYVKGVVFDMTPGTDGLWWRRLSDHSGYAKGIKFIAMNGLNDGPKRDFRRTLYEDSTFDVVAYDPPYKLNGNPKGLAELSERYGVDIPTKVDQRHEMMLMGFFEALRIARKYVIVKCQDQVANNVIHWQTQMLIGSADPMAKMVERFDMLGHHIPQPMEGREQRHAHARPSTLLVFKLLQERIT